jgi:prefoldin subunit 5
LDYFWLLTPVSAGFGALITGLVLRRLGISRISYLEAKQLLSAMVSSLSKRIEWNEALTRELSEQLQLLNTNQTHLRVEGQTTDDERLLEYTRDSNGSMERFIERVDALQTRQKKLEDDVQEIRYHIDRLSSSEEASGGARPVPVGVVTEDTLAKLTPTEKAVLELLARGPKAAPEIGRFMTKSREHTARLMKSLFEQGFVQRETDRQPYEYRLNEKVKGVLTPRAQQQVSQPEH